MASDQLRGDFAAFLNRDKQPGDKRPIFEGHVCKPGETDKYEIKLWANEYADKVTGEIKIRYSGEVSPFPKDQPASAQVAALVSNDAGETQTAAGITVEPRQVALLPNQYKAEAPGKNRPDLTGAVNFGDNTPPVRLSVWLQQTRNGQPMLQGASSFPLPGKTEAEMQDAAPELADMVATGTVSKGMPKAKDRGGRA